MRKQSTIISCCRHVGRDFKGLARRTSTWSSSAVASMSSSASLPLFSWSGSNCSLIMGLYDSSEWNQDCKPDSVRFWSLFSVVSPSTTAMNRSSSILERSNGPINEKTSDFYKLLQNPYHLASPKDPGAVADPWAPGLEVPNRLRS
jgi:hypothetical protein